MVAARYAAVRPDADRWLRARYAAAACLSIDRKPRAVSLGRTTDDLLNFAPTPLASRSPVAHYIVLLSVSEFASAPTPRGTS